MIQARKFVPEKMRPSTWARPAILAVLALVYLAAATLSTWNVIAHAQASTRAIEQILLSYSMKNEGAEALQRFDKDNPFLGLFVSAPIKKNLELPTAQQANEALGSDLTRYLKAVREESSVAAWWSWFLINLSLAYVLAVMVTERSFTARGVLFSLTCISVFCFFIGILAPALVIWTAPTIPMPTGDLSFVLQHKIRGIAAIIWELLTSGHWIIGGFLLLFSILTPLAKASLTFFITASRSQALNFKIGEVLHTIGKWSMADVFVAALFLAIYALKAQQATRSVPCLGLYYFTGYCLLSMTTTEILMRSGIAAAHPTEKPKKRLGAGVISGLCAGWVCFVLGTGAYTYQQYTLNMKKPVPEMSTPQKLDNANLVLPGHK